jgi:hypothetical protein
MGIINKLKGEQMRREKALKGRLKKEGIEGYVQDGFLDVSIWPPLATVSLLAEEGSVIYCGVEDLEVQKDRSNL